LVVSRPFRWCAALAVALSVAGLPAQTMADGGHGGAGHQRCADLGRALTLAPNLTHFPGVVAEAVRCGEPANIAATAPGCAALIAAIDLDHRLRSEQHVRVRARYKACVASEQSVGSGSDASGGSGDGGGTGPQTASGVRPRASFQDLSGYGWAQSAVVTLARLGILQGVGGGRFDPAGQLTRADFAALMVRVFHLPQPAQPTVFTDVPAGFWAYADIEAAAPYMGRFHLPDGLAFEPDLPETRIDVAATIGEIMAADGLAQTPSAARAAAIWQRFSDGAAVPAGLSQDSAVTVELGLMQGLPGGSFGVDQSLDRAQAAVLLYRVLSATETMGSGAGTVWGTVYGGVYGSGGGQKTSYLLPPA
jgi:hypothetical protein